MPSKNMLISGQAPESYAHNIWNPSKSMTWKKKYVHNRNILIT
jgi:hypothetical protein